MSGSPRKKRSTEYLKFRPYEAIGDPGSAKGLRHGVGVAALKGGVIAVVFVGLPSLLLVPLLTYLLNEFVNLPTYLAQVGWNALIPLALMVLLAVVSGALSLRGS
jgi:hypothetical protein